MELESKLAELKSKLASQEAKNKQVLDALNTTLWLLATMTKTSKPHFCNHRPHFRSIPSHD
jgi:hypothetical protein